MPMGGAWIVTCLLLHNLAVVTLCLHHGATGCSNRCYCSESVDGGLAVRCSSMNLARVPRDLPNHTRYLYLDFNHLTSVPADSFLGLSLLSRLDLSHNELVRLEPGAFRGLAGSLRFVDLSSNKLEVLDPDAFGELQARANLTHNPWHCDCTLQMALPQLELEPASLAGIVCQTSVPEDASVKGLPFLLATDVDLCAVVKKTTDVAMLVTMFGWFIMVISYLVYYVRHNQEDARRHTEYLRSLSKKQGKSEEACTCSTVV